MPSLNLRNPLRRDPSRPTLRERAAALRATAAKLIQRPKPKAAASTADEAGAILDAILVSRVRELVAIEASQDATMRATSFADAHDSAEWVQMERERETILAQVIATPAHTIEGMKAKATLLDLGSIKHFQEPFERLTQSIEADAAALGVSPLAAAQTDPHVVLLPALRQAHAWVRAARPIDDRSDMQSAEWKASKAVLDYMWRLADRIIALPAPKTLAGLGAMALAMSVQAEAVAGPDPERNREEHREAAVIRAMMSVAGVEPLPGWTGFGDEPDHSTRWSAMLAQEGAGSLPAWAIAGKTGPDDERSA